MCSVRSADETAFPRAALATRTGGPREAFRRDEVWRAASALSDRGAAFEVRFADSWASKFFVGTTCRAAACGRKSSSEQAMEQARAFARAERDKG